MLVPLRAGTCQRPTWQHRFRCTHSLTGLRLPSTIIYPSPHPSRSVSGARFCAGRPHCSTSSSSTPSQMTDELLHPPPHLNSSPQAKSTSRAPTPPSPSTVLAPGTSDSNSDYEALRGAVVALGKFDALHIGHRTLTQRAAALGVGPTCMLSFSHMAQVLKWTPRLPLVAPCDRPRVLSLWAQQCHLAAPPHEARLDFREIRSLSPEQFVRLLADCGVRGVVAGANYRFGYRAAGDAHALTTLCRDHGIECDIVDIVNRPYASSSEQPRDAENLRVSLVSSTRVREALASGDLRTAQTLLGRDYRLVCGVDNATTSNPGDCIQGGRRLHIRGFLNQAPGEGRYTGQVFHCRGAVIGLEKEVAGAGVVRQASQDEALGAGLMTVGRSGAEVELGAACGPLDTGFLYIDVLHKDL